MSCMDEIVYAKPALWDASRRARARHLLLAVRLTIRCALRGHEWKTERPCRGTLVTACQVCGEFIGTAHTDNAACRWYRPEMRSGGMIEKMTDPYGKEFKS